MAKLLQQTLRFAYLDKRIGTAAEKRVDADAFTRFFVFELRQHEAQIVGRAADIKPFEHDIRMRRLEAVFKLDLRFAAVGRDNRQRVRAAARCICGLGSCISSTGSRARSAGARAATGQNQRSQNNCNCGKNDVETERARRKRSVHAQGLTPVFNGRKQAPKLDRRRASVGSLQKTDRQLLSITTRGKIIAMTILLATANSHKIEELSGLLRAVPNLEVLSLRDFTRVEMPEETGATMCENARLKAQSVMAQTGLISLADDSGIEVDCLNGAPGVHSARWIRGSDEERMMALLARVNESSTRIEERSARYRCAICVAFPDGTFLETEATCEGRIATEPKGDNGFGYDPIFEITEATQAPIEYSNCTMAQVPNGIKAQVSHRARAVAQMVKLLSNSDL